MYESNIKTMSHHQYPFNQKDYNQLLEYKIIPFTREELKAKLKLKKTALHKYPAKTFNSYDDDRENYWEYEDINSFRRE